MKEQKQKKKVSFLYRLASIIEMIGLGIGYCSLPFMFMYQVLDGLAMEIKRGIDVDD